MKHTQALEENFVTGLIHLSLALRQSGQTAAARAIARRLIVSSLRDGGFKLIDGVNHGPGPDANEYREYIICKFAVVNSGTRAWKKSSAKKRVILQRLANGDWQKRNKFEHYCSGPECCQDIDHCIQQIDNLLLPILFGSFRMYSRNNYTGSERTMLDVCIPFFCHGLLTDVIEEMFSNVVENEDGAHDRLPAVLDEPGGQQLEDGPFADRGVDEAGGQQSVPPTYVWHPNNC
jgi:hypothetical protein